MYQVVLFVLACLRNVKPILRWSYTIFKKSHANSLHLPKIYYPIPSNECLSSCMHITACQMCMDPWLCSKFFFPCSSYIFFSNQVCYSVVRFKLKMIFFCGLSFSLRFYSILGIKKGIEEEFK